MPYCYSEKLLLEGNIFELYEYKKPITRLEEHEKGAEESQEPIGRARTASEEDKIKNRIQVLYRAKNEVKRLINTNAGMRDKFLTLTFAQDIRDIKQANYEFKKFRQRLEYYLKEKIGRGGKIEYICIPEFQDETRQGVVHYHVYLFNVPFLPWNVIRKIWKHGNVNIKRIRNMQTVGNYVTKYMTKNIVDDRLMGEKCFFRSRNLKKPIEIVDSQAVTNFMESFSGNTLYQNTFISDFQGEITYRMGVLV